MHTTRLDPAARIAALLLAAVLGACAQTAKPTAAAASGDRCQQLATEIERIEAERREAAEKADTAWKAVLPFAVVARKLTGKADADLAAKQIAELQQQARSEGCTQNLARSTR